MRSEKSVSYFLYGGALKKSRQWEERMFTKVVLLTIWFVAGTTGLFGYGPFYLEDVLRLYLHVAFFCSLALALVLTANILFRSLREHARAQYLPHT